MMHLKQLNKFLMFFLQIIMSTISHTLLAQKPMPVASNIFNRWGISHKILEDDFLSEAEPAPDAVIHQLPHASVLAVLTVESDNGGTSGS